LPATPEETREQRRTARKARRHAERRQAITDAARQLLLSDGIENFTISAVASFARVSKPAVYYYFDSKEELITELAADALRAEVSAIERALPSSASGLDSLVRMVRAYVEHYRKNLQSFRILYVWTRVLGASKEVEHSGAQVENAKLNQLLERGLERDRDAGKLNADLRPQKLVSVARAMALGVVFMAGVASGDDGASSRFTELQEEACRTLEQLAR
jgi:AcrR family transcriptional regulator